MKKITIAVISILGPIVDGDQVPGVASGDNVSSLFDKIIENDQIKAVVVRVITRNIFASELIRDALLRVKKKIYLL